VIRPQRVDFIAVPTQDRDRAERFYAETLGLEKNPLSTEGWVEFETGNVTLALVRPDQIGLDFAPLPFGAVALRVANVEEAKAKLEEAGVEFRGEVWDSGVCNGAAFYDTEGNGLLLHHRYAPFADGREP
jgi:catechol 2,3-dioxygenase-like lactoylglutathione lyase family enzyme